MRKAVCVLDLQSGQQFTIPNQAPENSGVFEVLPGSIVRGDEHRQELFGFSVLVRRLSDGQQFSIESEAVVDLYPAVIEQEPVIIPTPAVAAEIEFQPPFDPGKAA